MSHRTIISEINALKKDYQELFLSEGDIKALTGVERCIEMKMKVMGIDGKQKEENQSAKQNNQSYISLSELPTKLLNEILEHINSKNMEKQ